PFEEPYPRRAEGPPPLRGDVPDLRSRPVLVVGLRADEHRDPAGGHALVEDLLVRRPFCPAGSPLDRPLDVVVGHAGFARPLDGRPLPHVAGRIPAAFLRGDDDLPRQLADQLAALLVDLGLLDLDVVPLGVSGHSLSLASRLPPARPEHPPGRLERPGIPAPRPGGSLHYSPAPGRPSTAPAPRQPSRRC